MEILLLDTLNTAGIGWWQIPTVFILGILTSFTPCVYPILPVTIATFAQRKHTRIGPLLYCTGFSLIYAALGFIAAYSGNLFGQVATHPWVLLLFANGLLYFAALNKGIVPMPSMPMHQFKNPSSVPLVMGMVSALVAAPCTSPVLGGLLMFVATHQQPTVGALLLFSFALGMSTLLLLAGTSTRVLIKLPKSGKWLSYTNTLTSLILIAMAQYFLIQAGKSWL
ncbi:sulfite exporter TauE/SafE family protein [Pseudoalteromonas sp. SMS1]|uniref:cytochrome c biogenesis protein CcdA n=1 Tax=Pseudoalteromonas sp. SMS1 TaxID=2908894 RepID=UPI001F48FC2D|nr:cytochrome c biogenesis protein CcdA [Pseudoalteromonas sp. SMS1]MCF2860272.1 sulfite exporter TauE/SafE family protein [Pseudoalteromonas sp. SMS1]